MPYSLLLSVGHDEYWSVAMRAAIDAHVDRGRNIAFFTGNTSGYRIHFTDDETAITCAEIGPPDKDPDNWVRDHWFEMNAECRVTGVATHFGGGWWDGKRALTYKFYTDPEATLNAALAASISTCVRSGGWRG